jgi:hypothetical protein
MGEQSETGGTGNPNPPHDLDIPGGQRPRPRNDFVAAVEERASLQNENAASGSGSRRRRKTSRLIPAIVVVLVVAVALALGFFFLGGDDRGSDDTQHADDSATLPDDIGGLDSVEAPDQDMAASDLTGDTQDRADAGADALDQAAPAEPETAADLGETDDADAAAPLSVPPEDTATADGDMDMAPAQDGASGDDADMADESQAEAANDTDLVLLESVSEPGASAETDIVDTTDLVPPEPEQPPASTTQADAGTVSDQAADAVAAAPPLPVRMAGSHSGARVQLASYGSVERAQVGWLEIEPNLKDVLEGHDAMIEEAALDSGTVFRLQVGYFGSAVEARNFCDAVLDRRLDCLVIPN